MTIRYTTLSLCIFSALSTTCLTPALAEAAAQADVQIQAPVQAPVQTPVQAPVQAQVQVTSSALIPMSSLRQPGNEGVSAHTNILIAPAPAAAPSSAAPQAAGSPPFPGFLYNTPASLACIAGLAGNAQTGCNPNNETQSNSGVSGTSDNGGISIIAVVDAYDYPTAANDLKVFSAQFGLPSGNFEQDYATGTKPAVDPTGTWELEESLDIESAHAMAPNARIVLVEAASTSWPDLMKAVQVASNIVVEESGGLGGIVSMSFSGDEWAGETTLDSNFTTPGVTYIASSGDWDVVEWPSASPNVISAGGTTLFRNSNGAYAGQEAWAKTGAGPSVYEPRPSYQNGIAAIVGNARGTPDISFDGDPNTGIWMYNSYATVPGWAGYAGWSGYGGTSLSAPALAGIINSAGNTNPTSTVLNQLYTSQENVNIGDVTAGTCGAYSQYSAKAGWDFCTGLGTPWNGVKLTACNACSAQEANYTDLSCPPSYAATFGTAPANLFYVNVTTACASQNSLNVFAITKLCEATWPNTNCLSAASYASSTRSCWINPPNQQDVIGQLDSLYVACGHK